jgi:hypothetical protein
MSSKKTYYMAAFIGSIIGAYIPRLWGADSLTFSSVLFSGLGGIAGIIIVWKIFE